VAALVAAGIPVVNDGSAGRSANPASRELGARLSAPIMHDKYLVFDGQAVWTGSTNLSVNDLTRNHNNAIFF
jgi:phosphatidylserine/phosphatidylglycerophosphate/cardiolipin synthase-like enzyme